MQVMTDDDIAAVASYIGGGDRSRDNTGWYCSGFCGSIVAGA